MSRRHPLLSSVLGSVAIAGAVLFSSAAAVAQAPQVKLADKVVPADAYKTPTTRYVAAADQPILQSTNVYGTPTGESLKRGQKVDALAEAMDGLWILVGRNGTGIGYVPRSLLTPEQYAGQLPKG